MKSKKKSRRINSYTKPKTVKESVVFPYKRVRIDWIDIITEGGWGSEREFKNMKLATPVTAPPAVIVVPLAVATPPVMSVAEAVPPPSTFSMTNRSITAPDARGLQFGDGARVVPGKVSQPSVMWLVFTGVGARLFWRAQDHTTGDHLV